MQSSFIANFQYTPLGDGGCMDILLTNIGKRFNRDWIFRHINYTFQQSISYAITGPNGSGKSTLLQTIAGAIAPSEGAVEYRTRNKEQRMMNTEQGIENRESRIREETQALDDQLETGNWKPGT